MTKWILALALLISAMARAAPLVFIADLNGRYGSVDYHPRISEAVSYIIGLRPAAVVIAGDMIAGQAVPPLEAQKLQAMWASFDETVHKPLREAGIEVLAVPGNHDASIYPSFVLERAAYDAYWQPFAPASLMGESSFPWYYALEIGNFLVVGLDVTAPGPLPAEQEAFLQGQRSAAQASQATLVVVTHLPRYPLANGRETETFQASVPAAGEIWLSGHHHAFFEGISRCGVRHVGLPALGGNRRSWLGGNQKSPFGLVVLDGNANVVLHPWPGFEADTSAIGPGAIGDLRNFNAPSAGQNN